MRRYESESYIDQVDQLFRDFAGDALLRFDGGRAQVGRADDSRMLDQVPGGGAFFRRLLDEDVQGGPLATVGQECFEQGILVDNASTSDVDDPHCRLATLQRLSIDQICLNKFAISYTYCFLDY